MHRDHEVVGLVGERRPDHPGIDLALGRRVVAARRQHLALLRIAQIGEGDVVELEVAAAGVVEGADGLRVGRSQVGVIRVHVGVEAGIDHAATRPVVQHAGTRDRHLGDPVGVPSQEPEVLDHRVAGEADAARDPEPLGLQLHALKLNALVEPHARHAVEMLEEVVMPEGAAELAVRHGFQASLLLTTYERHDLGIFDGPERVVVDLSRLVPFAGGF